jgi:hypothetical protein
MDNWLVATSNHIATLVFDQSTSVLPFIRGCHTFSKNGEWGKRRAKRIPSPWRKVWHPFVARGEWRMENGEWELPLPPACGKNLCFIHTLGFEVRFLFHHALFVVWSLGERSNPKCKIIKPSTRSFLHSPFSNLWEWALRHSRRAYHIPILHSPRMGRKRCDNPYYEAEFTMCWIGMFTYNPHTCWC